MTHYRKLVGKLCYLSPYSPDDADAQTRWENDLAVAIPLGDEAYTTTAREKLAEHINGAIQNQAHFFSIIDLENEQVIGRVLLFSFDPVNRTAMVGILIGEKEFRGRGYGSEALVLMLDYAFNLLNLHNVMLGVFAFNERAVQTYRKLGFNEIGRRREGRMLAGKAHDVILMDMLEDEFRAKYPDSQVLRVMNDLAG